MPLSRHLAAIMFTDIVGYTSLMGEDENKALDVLNENRILHKSFIESFNGNIIKELGDGIMATFQTAADAVNCAVKILSSTNKVPDLHLRIGIHLGDIIFENNDVFGDGVNIASRLQVLAAVDTIYISEAVQKTISNKKNIVTKFVSNEKLKNVKHAVAVYEVITDNKKQAMPAAKNFESEPEFDKSIAVLPFLNLSNQPEQEYFSDGIAEEILNSLTQLKDIKVAGRSSSFQFRGKGVDIKEVGSKLNVATVLEGSVQRQANKLRINAQLINAKDGFHLWSEKYDRKVDDIFAIQDEIALAITQKLKITLLESEKPILNKPTVNKQAYDLYLKGLFYWNRRGPGLLKGLTFFQQAIDKEPQFSLAYSGLAQAYTLLAFYSLVPPHVAIPKAKQAAEKAIELDATRTESYSTLAFITLIYDFDWPAAKMQFEKAIAMNTNYAATHYWYSNYISFVDKDYKLAIDEANKAIEIEPLLSHCYNVLSSAYLCQGIYEEAVKASTIAKDLDANSFLSYNSLGMGLACLKRYDEAIAVLNEGAKVSNRHQYTLYELSWLYSLVDNTAEAKKIFDELVQRSSTEFISGLSLCVAAYASKEYDKSLEYIEAAFEERAGFLSALTSYPIYSFIKTDERFKNFIERMKFPEAANK